MRKLLFSGTKRVSGPRPSALEYVEKVAEYAKSVPERAPGQKASHLKPYSQSVSCSIIGASK